MLKEPSGLSPDAQQQPPIRRPSRLSFPGSAKHKVGFRKLGPYLDLHDSVIRGQGDVELGNTGIETETWDWDFRSGEHELTASGYRPRRETERWGGDGIIVDQQVRVVMGSAV